MNNCVYACVWCVRARACSCVCLSLVTVTKYIYSGSLLHERYEKTSSCHELMSLISCFSFCSAGNTVSRQQTLLRVRRMIICWVSWKKMFLWQMLRFFFPPPTSQRKVSSPRNNSKKKKQPVVQISLFFFFRQRSNVPDLSFVIRQTAGGRTACCVIS